MHQPQKTHVSVLELLTVDPNRPHPASLAEGLLSSQPLSWLLVFRTLAWASRKADYTTMRTAHIHLICIHMHHIILFKNKITQHWNFWWKFCRQNILKIKGEFSTQFKRPLLEAKSVDAMEGCKITKFGWGKPLKSRKRRVACGDGWGSWDKATLAALSTERIGNVSGRKLYR